MLVDLDCWNVEIAGHLGGEGLADRRKVIVDGKEFEVELELDGEDWLATVEGKTFRVKLPEATASVPRKVRSSGRSVKSGTISASMPGKVVTIEVKVGDVVEEGQVVLILEAMKMQNEIAAPISGTVKEINCSESDSIEANVPLIVIESHQT